VVWSFTRVALEERDLQACRGGGKEFSDVDWRLRQFRAPLPGARLVLLSRIYHALNAVGYGLVPIESRKVSLARP